MAFGRHGLSTEEDDDYICIRSIILANRKYRQLKDDADEPSDTIFVLTFAVWFRMLLWSLSN
jgi:hypothetical protein